MWQVQTGKGRGSYTTTYTFDREGQARFYYACLNTHSGYKKRLLHDGVVVARLITQIGE